MDEALDEIEELWNALENGKIRNIADTMRAEDYEQRGILADNYTGYTGKIKLGHMGIHDTWLQDTVPLRIP